MHVLGVIVHVVKMDDARLMSLHDIRRQQQPLGNILGNLARHIVPLNGIHGGVLIGILLHDLLVVALDQAENLIVGGVGRPGQGAGVAVADIALGGLIGAVAHQLRLHQLLNLLHVQRAAYFLRRRLHVQRDLVDLRLGQLGRLAADPVGLFHRRCNLYALKALFTAVSLDDFHGPFVAPSCLKAKIFFPVSLV
ncbi:hypothetical protein SDC9_168627 [bioreactor metagenome]|uniref:Uncharacterized protein n=1 Tax=bioreactor metagenome TaxID=1076179 RepID=A0A645G316_9ZZZZ